MDPKEPADSLSSPAEKPPELPPENDSPPPIPESTAPVPAATGKADPGKRFLALLIDCLIGIVIYVVFAFLHPALGFLAYGAYMLTRDGLELDFMKHRSLGKQLLKLRVVRNDGGKMDLHTSIMRNWPLAIGSIVSGIGAVLSSVLASLGTLVSLIVLVEAILVLVDNKGLRLGDKTAGTQVKDE